MAFKFFRVPIRDAGNAEAELNTFQRSHRILSVDRRFVDMGENSVWVICLDFWDDGERGPTENRSSRSSRNRVDYMKELPKPQFLHFSRLRDWRTEAARLENVPRYVLFDNRQLSEMVKQRVSTLEGLSKIAGIGAERLEKYGARVLEELNKMWAEEDAASQSLVEPDSGSS